MDVLMFVNLGFFCRMKMEYQYFTVYCIVFVRYLPRQRYF